MRGALVEAGQNRSGVLRHMGHLVVITNERPDRVEVGKPHGCRELDTVGNGPAKQVDREEAVNPSRLDGWDHLPRTIAS